MKQVEATSIGAVHTHTHTHTGKLLRNIKNKAIQPIALFLIEKDSSILLL